jgi:glycosyltransferase involved in cell wall biosynthesis/predicted metal-dependent phosphoesterase TrpH
MTLSTASRVDMHCHSTASVWSKLGVQRALGLPECATPPSDVLELATRRGMDFVTITDHDTIAGVLEIADDPRVFVSEELTVGFQGEAQAVHVLCYGITPDDHGWLQAHNDDVEGCAAYLHDNDITTALAHPFFAVAAPLQPRHRRRLAQLFPVWETRNGSRAAELNAPAAVYIETHGGTGIGGSDDHAGVDIGRTFTQTAKCTTPQGFLAQIRNGEAAAGGEQGSAAKWAHAAMGLATRALGRAEPGAAGPSPRAVMSMVERIVREGGSRGGAIGADLGPDDARAMMAAWLSAVDLDLEDGDLLALLQAEDFSHAALFRRARRCHERKLAKAVDGVVAATSAPGGDLLGPATGLFDACVAAIPYAPAAAFLGQEKAKLSHRDPATEPRRVALVADGVGAMHGVTHTLDEIRERGVPGFEVEVVGTDPNVDRRLSAVAEVEVPYYAGLTVGVPSLPAIVEVLADGRYDLVQVCSPGPAGVAAMMIARVMDVPVLGGYHTELAAYVGMRSMDPMLEAGARMAIAAFYGQCATVLSPSEASDAVLATMGIDEGRVQRWDRGVDLGRFRPGLRTAPVPGDTDRVNVLYAGRQTREKGADLLADAFLAARARDPRLHLQLAGGGPEEDMLRARLGEHATFLGWLEGDALAHAYADADVFLFASRTDTFGQVLLEAQASRVPVVAVAEGGPCSLVEDGVTGRLCAPDADALADAVVELAASPLRRATLARTALAAVGQRTWERALQRLSDAYGRTLAEAHGAARHAADPGARAAA